MALLTIIQDIKDIIVLITPLVLGFLTYMGIKVAKKQEELRKEVDGKLSLLLKETAAAKLAEGIQEGMAKQKEESATTAEQVTQAIKNDPEIEIKKNGH